MLPSGLPEIVSDEEKLARFLIQSNHFNRMMVKPSAFLPSRVDRETSIFRHAAEPSDTLWKCGKSALGERPFYGAGIIAAEKVRATLLEVVCAEPPELHAVIIDWPWFAEDPDLEKARHKSIAQSLARDADLVLVHSA